MSMPSSAEDAGPSAQTCCATCGTVFEVAPELLASSDTRVRCGECFAIFDARANLVADVGHREPGRDAGSDPGSGAAHGRGGRDGEAAGNSSVAVFPGRRTADAPDDPGELDVTYSDFDLFSEDADLPDVAYFDQTRDTPDFDFDSVAPEHDETFSDTLFVQDVTIDAAVTAARPGEAPPAPSHLEVVGSAKAREPLAFTYRDPEPRESGDGEMPATAARAASATIAPASARIPGPSAIVVEASGGAAIDPDVEPFDPAAAPGPVHRRRWPAALMALSLAALLAGLHVWRVRDAPGDDPFVRPAYVALCRVTGCTVPARVAIDRLRLVKREVFSHPTIDDALVIDVAFRNEAPFAQRYPVLVVRLSNPSGKLVARRAFRPDEYLPRGMAGGAAGGDAGTDAVRGGAPPALAAGALFDISLEVTDPGEDASSFEVEFRES